MNGRLAAVITAYKPDEGFARRFSEATELCHRVIVVDNTPGGHSFGGLGPRFIVVQDGVNKGLGPALNAGLRLARAEGVGTVFLFDQDSSPSRTLLAALLAALERTGDERSCVGPLHVDDQAAAAAAPMHAAGDNAGPRLQRVSCLATSGMTFRLGSLTEHDYFSSDLFLDFVDFEWCWRLGSRGWRFYKAHDAVMPHRLGLAQRRLLGLTYHVPSPYRHYFQFRDTLRLLTWSHAPLYSKFRLGALLPLKLVCYPFLLDRGAERLRWMVRGTIDAVRGTKGMGAAARLLGSRR